MLNGVGYERTVIERDPKRIEECDNEKALSSLTLSIMRMPPSPICRKGMNLSIPTVTKVIDEMHEEGTLMSTGN
mgnify:CR=1 FL=1